MRQTVNLHRGWFDSNYRSHPVIDVYGGRIGCSPITYGQGSSILSNGTTTIRIISNKHKILTYKGLYMYDHTQSKVTDAISITGTNVTDVLDKIRAELGGKPFEPYTPEEQRALLLLAAESSPVLFNTLGFHDLTLMYKENGKHLSTSEIIERLEKYPPTADIIIKTMAIDAARKAIKSVSDNIS